jgi:hypothetical protein
LAAAEALTAGEVVVLDLLLRAKEQEKDGMKMI